MTHHDMNTPTPDYGEPWSIQEGHLSTSLLDGKGDYFADIHEFVGEDSSVAWAKAERIVACVNACAGMADPAKEIQAMREAIKEAHYALAYVYNHGEGSCTFPYRTDDDLCSENRFHHVKDALDALQPFVP